METPVWVSIISGVVTGLLSWIIGRGKIRAQIAKSEADTMHVQLGNVEQAIEIWKQISGDLSKQLEDVTNRCKILTAKCDVLTQELEVVRGENNKLKTEVQNLTHKLNDMNNSSNTMIEQK